MVPNRSNVPRETPSIRTAALPRSGPVAVYQVTDLPVKTVADRVGYSSRSSFTRAFAACHGVGPLAFRSGARKPHASWSERMDAGAPRET